MWPLRNWFGSQRLTTHKHFNWAFFGFTYLETIVTSGFFEVWSVSASLLWGWLFTCHSGPVADKWRSEFGFLAPSPWQCAPWTMMTTLLSACLVVSDMMRHFYQTIPGPFTILISRCEARMGKENRKQLRHPNTHQTSHGHEWWSQVPGLVTPELSLSGQPEIPGVSRCEGGRVVKVVVSISLLRGWGCNYSRANYWHAQANYNHHTPSYRDHDPPSLSLAPNPFLSSASLLLQLWPSSRAADGKWSVVLAISIADNNIIVIQIFAHYSNFPP